MDGIEITPEMIEAGTRAYLDMTPDYLSFDEVVSAIYRAMATATGGLTLAEWGEESAIEALARAAPTVPTDHTYPAPGTRFPDQDHG